MARKGSARGATEGRPKTNTVRTKAAKPAAGKVRAARPGPATGRAKPAAAPIRTARRTNVDAGFIAFVLDQLDHPAMRARAMFGGHGLYRGERFFGIVYRARLYLKVDDATRPVFEEHGMSPFSPGPGTTMRGYYEVPAAVLEDAFELRRWTERALRVE